MSHQRLAGPMVDEAELGFVSHADHVRSTLQQAQSPRLKTTDPPDDLRVCWRILAQAARIWPVLKNLRIVVDHNDAVLRFRARPVLGAIVVGLAALASVGCAASVSAHVSVISGDGPYRAMWKQSWVRIETDEAPYKATTTSPGACNAGSTKQACVDADRTVLADMRKLQAGLKSVRVPKEYRKATTLTLLAVSHSLRGLTLRMKSLSAGNWTTVQRNTWFHQSNAQLLAAQAGYAQGWAAFPASSRPSPAPKV